VEITRSAKKGAVRAEKLEKIAKGISTGGKKDKAIKAIGKGFYKKVGRLGGRGECVGGRVCKCEVGVRVRAVRVGRRRYPP
jgi:hypothetical protein